MHRRATLLALIALSIDANRPAPIWAEGDHEEARRLRASGQILPLEKIIERAQTEHPGRLLDTELEREGGRYVYELELVDERGVVWELKYDARTGKLLHRERED